MGIGVRSMAGHRAWVGTMAAEKGREGEKGKAIHSNRSLAGGKQSPAVSALEESANWAFSIFQLLLQSPAL